MFKKRRQAKKLAWQSRLGRPIYDELVAEIGSPPTILTPTFEGTCKAAGQ